MRTTTPAPLVVVAAFSVGALAQPPARNTVEKLADGVYAVIYSAETEVEGNTLVVVNDDDVVVVDANAGLTTARATIAEIRKLTAKPVRYVINTHWHDDHVFGNQAYADEYPGVQFIAHPLTRRDIAEHAFGSNAFVVDLIAADVRRLEGYLETGKYRDGRAVEGELETRIRNYLAVRREALLDRQQFRAVVPTIDVADTLTLRRGRRTIEVRFLGRGNTRGDLVVHLPEERIVATGDLVVAPVPYATNVYAREWVRTLDALMALPAAIIVPGHGPVMRDWSYVRRVKSALELHLEAVATAKRSGASLARVLEDVRLPDVRSQFVGESEPLRTGYESFFRPTLLRNAWEELDPAIMQAAERSRIQDVVPGISTWTDGTSGVTAVVGDKAALLVASIENTATARAAVRMMRELTSRPVKHVVLSGAVPASVQEVLKESYPQAEMLPDESRTRPAASAPETTVDLGTRRVRISRVDGTRLVEVVPSGVKITRGGKAVRPK